MNLARLCWRTAMPGSSWSSLNVAFFALLSLFARPTLSACYPTHPIATTVLVAGQPAKVQWVEDNRQPLLHQIGMMDIHLLARNDTFVAFIGRSINALALKTTVSIPTKLPPNMRQYTLRFVPAGWKVHSGGTPPSYSATFTIILNPFTPSKSPSQLNVTAPHTQGLTYSQHSTLGLTQPTMGLITNVQSLPASTSTAQTTGEGKFPPGSQLTGGAVTLRGWCYSRTRKMHTTANVDTGDFLYNFYGVVALAAIGDLDMARITFRLLVVIWPAFMGFSLAI
ncbi:hypothetical protein CPB83DRAFT_908341 [Crepidotus variabilis]|uniref:Uncharacterized protein n=1 Tax=Crepidotus variabilis TaxID=179855 RepID=A0A9P6JNF2_9AGAR|nr:hypothetical protein CPB83DRAFT_908341 [Crepidotus variabilis]